jgi:hypothetical protein
LGGDASCTFKVGFLSSSQKLSEFSEMEENKGHESARVPESSQQHQHILSAKMLHRVKLNIVTLFQPKLGRQNPDSR